MKQITTGTVQTAQIEVTNLHDDTREFDITASVYFSPNSRRLLASMDIDYDKRGQQTVDKYAEYENSQTGGGGSS